ncbi:glycosyltransferase [Roseobacter sp. CCS2]|uniref:glycosyltransferase n=1 Tax=Roseobacter sp. CCS2 TaxID=391593 RepID=UPI0000F40537|nr:glycosyltransferase [Roseobacter sp. CCS2]EBA13968.1 putative glycosyltransferase involved in lipopolysaccharide biosynthesis [Roseobacter sp. CCS2]
MRSLDIVHLGKFYPPEFGGIESVTEALAVDHAQDGHRIEVLCFTRTTPGTETAGNLTIRRYATLSEVSSQPMSLRYMTDGIKRARTADILHVHTPNVLAAFVALFSARKTRIVVHWHADIEGKGMLGRLIRPIQSLLLKRANAIVATSQAYTEASPPLIAHAEKISVIPIGIADIEGGSQRTAVKPDQILFVGRLVPYKGLPVLFRAMAKMTRPARLVVVGSGPERKSLEALANDLNLSDRIDFLGKADQSALLELFQVSTVFCLPSINRLEAFGVVLLEAMRAGCPAISSDIPGSGVSWVNQSGMTFDLCDHDGLAARLDQVLADPNLREKYAQMARDRYEDEFGREKMSRRFLDLYASILP